MPAPARLRAFWLATLAIGLLPIANAGAAPVTVSSERKLLPPDPQGGAETGWAVALDGETVVVGADTDSRVVPEGGAAFVYVGTAVTPALQATLTASDAAPGDNLGVSVAVDGDVVVAGAFHRFAPTPALGKAYVFRRAGTAWTEEARLVAPDGQDRDAFGWAVAVAGDLAVVGAPKAWSGSPAGNGGVYVFERVDGVWTYDTKLTRSGEYAFGWSVAFDGTTLVVGAVLGPSSSPGRAFVYERGLGGTWAFRQMLSPSDLGQDAEFGNAVAVSGTRMVIGAWFDTAGGTAGSAYFFESTDGVWAQTDKFDAPGGAAAETFGEAVAIDGDRAIVTDSGLDVNGVEDIGATYVFRRGISGWSAAGTLRASDGQSGDYFGMSAAMQGSRLVLGAPYLYDDASQTYPGAAYLLQLAAGSKLVVRNAVPDNEARNAVQVKAKGLVVDLPFPGSPDDPTCAGGGVASVSIQSAASGTGFSQVLPCANWQQTGIGYRYRDPELDDGPCKEVYFRPPGTTTITCNGRGPSALAFDLEPGVQQLPVVATLTIGTQSYCTTFGGTLKRDGMDGLKLMAVNGGATEVCAAP